MNKTVLITGCSSGFGKLAAKKFHSEGWNVIATMRTPEKETDLNRLENVLVTKLDVTDPPTIDAAIQAGLKRFGAIHVLVNNAGYGGHALFEQSSDESIRSMFETNVFGVMNVTRAILPLMRQQKDSVVINVTSMAGMLGLPNNSVYSSSKFAAEGLTEAMALEYKPLGIKFRSVMPGAYPTTRFNANTDDHLDAGDEQLRTYGRKLHDHIEAIAETMSKHSGKTADPQEVANKIFECATVDTPIHNPVGADSQMLIEMMGEGSHQDFLNKIEEMTTPEDV